MKKLLILTSVASFFLLLASCGRGMDGGPEPDTNAKGIGRFKSVELSHPLDEKMIAAGQMLYEVKCASCHKLNDEKLVGPGWQGVTRRRTPEWIMNFLTNTEEMIDKDAAAQKMLEECQARMPNPYLNDVDARAMLEFMRNNDNKQ